jgi:hypothetical protein
VHHHVSTAAGGGINKANLSPRFPFICASGGGWSSCSCGGWCSGAWALLDGCCCMEETAKKELHVRALYGSGRAGLGCFAECSARLRTLARRAKKKKYHQSVNNVPSNDRPAAHPPTNLNDTSNYRWENPRNCESHPHTHTTALDNLLCC